ncbi:MAG: bifunctional deaminase-reductase domain protein [Fluviicola sp.]|nr:bifunctional deaminase-reductase domain protein [Fluviicola sp.]
MSLDAYCDHTAMTPDEEVHEHYTELLKKGDAILYGRTTYQLMQYWQPIAQNPSGEKSMDDFAKAIDQIPKIVFSNTLNPETIGWESAQLAKHTLEEEVLKLRQKPGRDIFIGSRSLIILLMNLHLLDELQLCVHPVVVGAGLPLFENINENTMLKLTKTKNFGGGAVILYYEPVDGKTT